MSGVLAGRAMVAAAAEAAAEEARLMMTIVKVGGGAEYFMYTLEEEGDLLGRLKICFYRMSPRPGEKKCEGIILIAAPRKPESLIDCIHWLDDEPQAISQYRMAVSAFFEGRKEGDIDCFRMEMRWQGVLVVTELQDGAGQRRYVTHCGNATCDSLTIGQAINGHRSFEDKLLRK